MENETREYINKLANVFTHKFDIKTPLNLLEINQIIKEIGGNLFFSKMSYFDNLFIEKHNNNSFSLHVNSRYDDVRLKLFYTLLGIGNLLLHNGYLLNDDIWNHIKCNERIYFNLTGQIIQSVFFAEEILMPEDKFISYIYFIKNNDTVDIGKVASYFNVTFNMALSRARRLDIITLI